MHIANDLYEICKMKDLTANSKKIYYVNNKKILLINSEKGVYFIEPICKHMGGALERGKIKGDFIICPLHGCSWNYTDGKCQHNSMKIKTYKSEIIDNSVYIKMY